MAIQYFVLYQVIFFPDGFHLKAGQQGGTLCFGVSGFGVFCFSGYWCVLAPFFCSQCELLRGEMDQVALVGVDMYWDPQQIYSVKMHCGLLEFVVWHCTPKHMTIKIVFHWAGTLCNMQTVGLFPFFEIEKNLTCFSWVHSCSVTFPWSCKKPPGELGMAFQSPVLESSAPICYSNIALKIVPPGVTCVIEVFDLA